MLIPRNGSKTFNGESYARLSSGGMRLLIKFARKKQETSQRKIPSSFASSMARLTIFRLDSSNNQRGTRAITPHITRVRESATFPREDSLTIIFIRLSFADNAGRLPR